MRKEGVRVGLLKVRCFRPFPNEATNKALLRAKEVLVLDRAFSPGLGGVLTTEVRAAFQGMERAPEIKGHIVGLGGREISVETIMNIVKDRKTVGREDRFVDLKEALLK